MKSRQRSRRLWLPLAALAVVGLFATSVSMAAPQGGADEIRVAIMTDCKGAFAFGYEPDIGGAQAALARYARMRVASPARAAEAANPTRQLA